MRRVYRAHEILDISVDTSGAEMTVDWSFRYRDTAPADTPVSRFLSVGTIDTGSARGTYVHALGSAMLPARRDILVGASRPQHEPPACCVRRF